MDLKPLHLLKARILVLEEDPVLRTGLCGMLAGAGFAVAERTSCASGADRIDLVLAGPDAKHMRRAALDRLDRSAPVILLIDRKTWTGFDFLDAANELGAVAVLQRPFPRAALLRLVAEVLSDPAPSTAPTDEGDAELPGLAELLLRLENPNFA